MSNRMKALALAGAKPRPKQHVDSVNLLPALQGGNLERNALFWHYPHYHGSTWTPGAAVRSGKWKLIEFYEEEAVELYNLDDDLGGEGDLHAEIRGERDLIDRAV